MTIMTSKEKANDLYSKVLEKQLDSQKYKERVITSWTAKHCALICVDEMLLELEDIEDGYRMDRVEYWQEVKQEIKKL